MLAMLGFQKMVPSSSNARHANRDRQIQTKVFPDASVQIRKPLYAREANLILRFLKDRTSSEFRQNSKVLAEMSLLAGGEDFIVIIRHSHEKQIKRKSITTIIPIFRSFRLC